MTADPEQPDQTGGTPGDDDTAEPADGHGTVYVTYVEVTEDLWTASWEDGDRRVSRTGGRADVMAWATTRPAATHFVLGAGDADWRPLTV